MITLPDERLQALKKPFQRATVSPEELVRFSIKEILARPESSFRTIIEYVMEKNSQSFKWPAEQNIMLLCIKRLDSISGQTIIKRQKIFVDVQTI